MKIWGYLGPMFRLAVVLALLLAPVAVAQEAPDERAAAKAMADATVRFTEAADAKEGQADRIYARGCRRAASGLSKRRRLEVAFLVQRENLRAIAELLGDDLARLRTDLANAQTRDPVLLSGRAAWRQLARGFESLPPARDPCAQVRAWRRAGMPIGEARRALGEITQVLSLAGKEYNRKIEAAADRLEELGVPEERAETFSED